MRFYRQISLLRRNQGNLKDTSLPIKQNETAMERETSKDMAKILEFMVFDVTAGLMDSGRPPSVQTG